VKIVLALGNPGGRYEATRHNVGWMVADEVAGRIRIAFKPGRGEYYEARGVWRGVEVVLVKPTTWMNNSGIAAQQVLERNGVGASEMLVLVDEVQFPVGKVQLKPSGSDGGHNGLGSLLYHLDTDGFPRLRCGVDRNFSPGEMADYVLSPFTAEERPVVEKMIIEATEGTLAWIELGTAQAMNVVNRRPIAETTDNKAETKQEEGTSENDVSNSESENETQ
jgi:PTH1 family peptidyl-tRNA hydrolase